MNIHTPELIPYRAPPCALCIFRVQRRCVRGAKEVCRGAGESVSVYNYRTYSGAKLETTGAPAFLGKVIKLDFCAKFIWLKYRYLY